MTLQMPFSINSTGCRDEELIETPCVTQLSNKATLGTQYYVLHGLAVLSNQVFQANIREKDMIKTNHQLIPHYQSRSVLLRSTVQYAGSHHEQA